jgi:hypothetical protein
MKAFRLIALLTVIATTNVKTQIWQLLPLDSRFSILNISMEDTQEQGGREKTYESAQCGIIFVVF